MAAKRKPFLRVRHVAMLALGIFFSYFFFLQSLSAPAKCWRSDTALRRRFALAVREELSKSDSLVRYSGSIHFDGEWALVTCQMSVLGLIASYERGDVERHEIEAPMKNCLRRSISETGLRFAMRRWNVDSVDEFIETDSAVLGYVGVALAQYLKHFEGDPALREAHETILRQLHSALRKPLHRLQTYPGVVFPADISTCIAAVAASGDRSLARNATQRFMTAFQDQDTSMLTQHVDSETGTHLSLPRASGTLFSAFFLRGVSRDDAEALWTATRSHAFETALGFAGIREYPAGYRGPADIDSGPIALGIGVSATGFALASAHGDDLHALFRIANLAGAFSNREARFLSGGPIGNSLLLAMMHRSAT